MEKEEAAAAASDFFSHLHRLAHFPLLSKPQSLSLSIARSEMSGALASRAVAAAQRAAAPAVAPAKSSNGHRRRRRQLLPMPTATTRSMLQSPRRLAPFSDRCRPAESISALPYGDDDDDLTPDDVLGEKSTRDETLFFFRCRRRKKKKKKKKRCRRLAAVVPPSQTNSRRTQPPLSCPSNFTKTKQTLREPPQGDEGGAQEGPSSTTMTRRRGS